MNRKQIEELVKKALENIEEEGSISTGARAYNPSLHATRKQYMGPELESKKPAGAGKADISTYTQDGSTKAPSKPNRESDAIDYSQIFEDQPIEEKISVVLARKLEALKKRDSKLYDKIHSFIIDNLLAIDPVPADSVIKQKFGDLEPITESYARFRNQTSKLGPSEHLHRAVKEIKKKLQEVNRLVEYTKRLREEVAGIEEVKYNRHTERALEQIQEMIKQTYIEAKKLK